MAKATSLPLYEKKVIKNNIARTIELIILFLLFSLLGYRLLTLKNHGFHWLVAFFCELWFTFSWIINVNCKWNQVEFKSYPERLLQCFKESELPRLDMFVTTADPTLEPPILTINTVISLLAVDYPANKLACYVSDDAASPLAFYSLVEASKFAKIWVPFCKKYNVQVRAPFRYFTSNAMLPLNSSLEFQEDWKRMKDEYARLCKLIEVAAKKSVPCDLTGEFAVFSNIERRNHPTIIKVIWENKEALSNGLPHLVYISREKRPKDPHHYKAGAMNVLTRVSGVMTNAPFMLNVDCDMYANNPQVVLDAICFLLGAKDEKESGYVQYPQQFYDGLKDDPFGNQLIVTIKFIGGGMAGLQGPLYGGTGCFHRRKIIYGSSPENKYGDGELSPEHVQKTFGKSMKFIKLVAQTLSPSKTVINTSPSISSAIEEASYVASCGYEHGTSWGKKVGWMYGSATEDVLTGLTIQKRGWGSIWSSPSPYAFLGCAPSCGPSTLTQQKRWTTGTLEILFSSKSPIVATITGKLKFRQCLVYLWLLNWGVNSIFVICYASLPAFCIFTNSYFLPKVNEPAIFIPLSIFVIYNSYSLSEYFQAGQTIRGWWNNQRMARLITMTSWLFGFLSVIPKLLGFSDTVFEVTNKDHSTNTEDGDDKTGRFTFDNSPIFVPGVTVLLVNLTAFGIGLMGFKQQENQGRKEWGIGELVCSFWIILCFWAFLKGFFGRGKYGIPLPTIYKSGALALLFVHLSRSWSQV